jgi:type I restriction enzyme S subunit
LGEIPVGWSIGLLSDLIDVKYGKDHRKLSDGKIPVYGSGGLMRHASSALYDGESILIPRKGTLNNIMYVNEAFWTVDTMFYSIMKMKNIATYVFHTVKSNDFTSMDVGSAVPSMTTDILNNIPVVIPRTDILVEFEAIISPMYKQLFENKKENMVLNSLRDTLLPKLMSGELSVVDL